MPLFYSLDNSRFILITGWFSKSGGLLIFESIVFTGTLFERSRSIGISLHLTYSLCIIDRLTIIIIIKKGSKSVKNWNDVWFRLRQWFKGRLYRLNPYRLHKIQLKPSYLRFTNSFKDSFNWIYYYINCIKYVAFNLYCFRCELACSSFFIRNSRPWGFIEW